MSRETGVLPEQRLDYAEAYIRETPEIAGFQGYEHLRNNQAAQRKAFIAGEQPELSLTYPDLTFDNLGPLAQKAEHAALMLTVGDQTDKTRALYNTVEYRLSEMALIGLAISLQDPSLSQKERVETLQWFKWTNDALYGKPEPEVFSTLFNKRITSKLTESQPVDSHAAQLQAELEGLVGAVEESGYQLYRPSQQTVERLAGLVDERFDSLVDTINPDETYDVDGMVGALRTALNKVGAYRFGWKAKIAKNSSALAVSAHQKIVEVGENRPELKGKELSTRIMHEIGIHALRSINAEQSGWLSAAYGQDGYLPFEEALATALEDAYNGKFVDHGVDYYLIAGLAYGLDGHETRDFREVYEIMWRTHALDGLQEDGANFDEKALDEAKSKAFTQCLRMFRGTSTKDKGVIYSKDLAYFVGQELAWSVLDNVQTQEDFELLLTGKLDLTKDDHLKVAHKILEANQ